MNILITGANGLLGFELAKLLCSNSGNTVYGFGRSASALGAKNYNHIICDLSDPAFTSKIPANIDTVIHLAQSERFRDFPAGAIDVFNVNTLSTLRLLDYSKANGIQRFIYASSGGVYGNKDDGFTEDSPIIGNGDLGFYLSSKLCSEILSDNYSVFFNVIQLRFFFVYGERQHKNMLIPRLLNSIINCVPITLTGTEGIKINPLYVSDAAEAIQAALSIDHSDKINVGGSEELSIKQIAETISLKTGIAPIYEYVNKETKNLIGDTRKMRNMLCIPKVSFEKGIEKLIEYQDKQKINKAS